MEEELKSNSNLTEKLSQLPSNYNFEIYKTLIRIKQLNATKVGLQFPEGL